MIFGFWREISNITRTHIQYIVTHITLECFPAKKALPGATTFYTSVWERHSEDSGMGSKRRTKMKDWTA